MIRGFGGLSSTVEHVHEKRLKPRLLCCSQFAEAVVLDRVAERDHETSQSTQILDVVGAEERESLPESTLAREPELEQRRVPDDSPLRR